LSNSVKIVDIQISGISGPVTVCLEGASTDSLYHFTQGAWVELPQRTYVNGTVCGVTESFSPFAAAQAVATTPKVVAPYTGPVISGRLSSVASSTGDSEFTLIGERLNLVASVNLEGKALTILSKSDSQIVVKTPAHTAGFVDLVLNSEWGVITFQNAFEYKAPVEVRAPVTTNKTVVISSRTSKALNLEQRQAVISYVSDASYGAVLTCSATYVSKADAVTAKAVATAACATAKKANAGLITRVTAPVFVKSKSARKVLLSLTK
jgi:hypothetical protein